MASILTQQRLIFSVCFVLFFVRSFFRRFFLHFPPIVHGRGNSTLLWMGHWAFWACASLTGVKRCLDRRPPRRTRAALELSVQHLGTNSRNVGLKNANFSSDLTDTEKINAADAQNPRAGAENRRKRSKESPRRSGALCVSAAAGPDVASPLASLLLPTLLSPATRLRRVSPRRQLRSVVAPAGSH